MVPPPLPRSQQQHLPPRTPLDSRAWPPHPEAPASPGGALVARPQIPAPVLVPELLLEGVSAVLCRTRPQPGPGIPIPLEPLSLGPPHPHPR
ncbi:hypothetical protein H8959_009678 [Pygathrix nigripes]